MAKVIRKNLLDSKLAKLENAQKLGLLEGGMLVAQRGQQRTPVLTGRLKRSEHATIPHKTGFGTMQTEVGTNVEYAKFPEFGTIYQKAQPYLRPALKDSAKDVAKLIYKAIVKALK